ncbi:hypothetical protein [Ruminococcus sp.]|uniref:hypothetical protein n=1 Tax=Ruminococcus sp. TaxID=41978 RepID=UPI002E8015F0|nr:hypothetical protein [Ruminococcus sp.]MEE3491596.1 hypothetical protein [Ruminococcus sp.]
MKYNSQTKLTDILAEYPWLPEELIKLDSRFKIVNTPIGKMMIKNATLADLSEKAGLSTDELLQKLQEMVDRHNGI